MAGPPPLLSASIPMLTSPLLSKLILFIINILESNTYILVCNYNVLPDSCVFVDYTVAAAKGKMT